MLVHQMVTKKMVEKYPVEFNEENWLINQQPFWTNIGFNWQK